MYSTAAQFRAYLQSVYRQTMSFQGYLAMLATQPVPQASRQTANDEIRRQLWHGDFLNHKSAECAR